MRVHRQFLDPGVHLLERLRLPGKSVLIGAVFMASLGWLTFEMLRAQREIVTFTGQECLGAAYLQSVRAVFEPELRVAEATALPEAGNLEAARKAAAQAFQMLQDTDARLGADLQTAEAFSALRGPWQAAAKEITLLIQESADRVGEGVASVQGVSTGLVAIEANIRSRVEGVVTMAAAMKENHRASHELAGAVAFGSGQAERNASATNQLASTVQEIARTTDELSAMANQLQALAARFAI